MLFFFLAVYISQLDAGNGVDILVPTQSSRPRSPDDISVANLNSEGACVCGPDQRSAWDILWSCLATIFACSWVAVHPNIPKPGASRLKMALKRLELMAWTVIAPELMIMWAMRQWIGARGLAKEYEDRNWTVTHGHFLQMGGFMLYEGEEAVGVLSSCNLRSLHDRGQIKFPTATEEEIEDRSKGDALSKTLAIGQSAWFISQCISRVAQGLITTELELITLAFALLNGLMYFFWWNKPLDVRIAIPVHRLITRASDMGSEDEDEQETEDGESTEHQDSEVKTETFFQRKVVPSVLQLLKPLVSVFSRIGDMSDAIIESRSHTIEDHAMKVPTFYAREINPNKMSLRDIIIFISFIGMLFGAIHAVGWNFSFPSLVETYLWRISSLIIVGVPFAMALERGLTIIYDKTHGLLKRLTDSAIDIMGFFIVYIGLPLYVVARAVLLVEAFIALRDLTPRALAQVQWTLFLPHI